jgi:hypothetical protein
MAQAWRDVLAVDAAKLVELMGPNPSDEALEALDRLRSLESRYTRDLAMSMMWSSMDEVPVPRRANYTVVREAGKPHAFVSPSGLRMPWTPTPIDAVRPLRIAATQNRVLHVLEHTQEAFQRTMRESPEFAYEIAVRKAAKGRPHSLFDGSPQEVLGVLDDAWRRRPARPVRQPDGRLVFDVAMGREIGSVIVWDGARPRPGRRTDVIRIVVEANGADIVTAHPL